MSDAAAAPPEIDRDRGVCEHAVEALIDAYLDWREESVLLSQAHDMHATCDAQEVGNTYVVYRAARDREAKAAAECDHCLALVRSLLARAPNDIRVTAISLSTLVRIQHSIANASGDVDS